MAQKPARTEAYQLIERVRSMVRARPEARISLEEAASSAGLSPVRLHQIFNEIQGENYGAFVRRVRLEYAVGLMRAFPERSCTMVALDAGFSESSDFARSFKRFFGIAPSHWDRLTPLAHISCAPDQEQPAALRYPEHPRQPSTPVTVRAIKARRVAAIHVPNAIDRDQLLAAFDRLEQWLADRDQLSEERRFIGLSQDSDLDTPAATYRFELAYEVGPDASPSDDVLIRNLPECLAAVLPCRGGEREFIAAWDHLQRGFLPNSKWGPALAPQMEIYYCDPRKTRMTYWDMDCVLPVKSEGDRNE